MPTRTIAIGDVHGCSAALDVKTGEFRQANGNGELSRG